MSDFDFQPYRDFVLRHHEQQQTLYTPTDVLLPLQVATSVKLKQRLEKEQEAPPEHKEEQLPVLEGLRKYSLGDQREHIILTGKPGSGKSTALQQLRLALAVEGLVPVLVQLKSDRSIPEMIQGEFRRAKQQVSLEQIDDWLLADQLVLLLDGVNEIPTDDLRQHLDYFRSQNLTVPMIFTTRDLVLGGDLGISRRLEMKPLTERQMRDFVGQCLPVDGEKLLAQLGDRLKKIAETPLLLQMLCDVLGQTGQIPENKGELFRLFDREYDKFKGFPPVSEDSRRFKSEILQQLAFVMMTGDASRPTEFWLTIDRNFAEREIEKFLRERQEINAPSKAKEWLEDLLKHHLLQVAADEGQIEFHHQLFQEYYAAKKLLGMFDDGHSNVIDEHQFQHFYLNYLKWTEPIALMIEMLEDEITIMRIIRLSETIDLILMASFTSFLKSQLKYKITKIIDDLIVPEYLKDTLVHIIEYGNYYHRSSKFSDINENYIPSFSTIEKSEGSVSVAGLEKMFQALSYEKSDIRKNAIKNLGILKIESAIPIFRKALSDENPSVRIAAVDALSKLKSDLIISPLFIALRDKCHYIRRSAVDVLGDLGSDAAIRPLVAVLRDPDEVMDQFMFEAHWIDRDNDHNEYDAEEKVMEENSSHFGVIKALGKIGSFAAINTLADLMKSSTSNTPHWMIKNWVAKVLENIKGDRAGHVLPVLLKLLTSDSGDETVLDAIQSIQANCTFYNYDIFCSPPPQDPLPIPSTATINNYNIEKLGILNTGKVDINGNQIGETK